MSELLCIYERCERPRSERLRAPLCSRHAQAVYLEVKDLIENATMVERIASARALPPDAEPRYPKRNGHVYFAEIGDYIKIGFSTNVPQRMATLGGTALYTFPGTRNEEKAMHARFGRSWSHREYFHRTDEIEAFLAEHR